MHRTRMIRLQPRPVCPDLEPDCFRLAFCDAWRCAVDLRRGLTGEVTHCPITGSFSIASTPLLPRRVAG